MYFINIFNNEEIIFARQSSDLQNLPSLRCPLWYSQMSFGYPSTHCRLNNSKGSLLTKDPVGGLRGDVSGPEL